MKTVIKRMKLVIVLVLVTSLCKAQSITVKSVTMQPSDLTAMEHVVLDLNGDTCALLKIKTDYLGGLEFPNTNQYVSTSYEAGIYSVYVPVIGRKLDFRHKDYLSGTIDMGEYGYKRLKGGKTYLVTLVVPRVNELKSKVVIKVDPADANVRFDGTSLEINGSGTYDIPINQGNYSYEVKKDNYETKYGSVNIGKNEVKTLSIKLKPIMYKCQIKGNVRNARILVDNIDYGNVGTLYLPRGQHDIRIQADGYIDWTYNVKIMSEMTIPFTMRENTVITHVHATPVTIYSPGASAVYKDNKKISGWYSGATIMIMPGKYLISDDRGNKKKIIVGEMKMTVKLQ
ncbi:MAG: PEGA domain-containing protein [Prevotella sp.]|nr:PEGA domain-containing protein [Prevotella sp.]